MFKRITRFEHIFQENSPTNSPKRERSKSPPFLERASAEMQRRNSPYLGRCGNKEVYVSPEHPKYNKQFPVAKDLQNPISLSYNNNKQYPVQWHNQTPNPPKQMPQNTISHNQSYIQFPKRDKYNSLNYNGGGPNTSYFGPEVDMEENGGGIRNIRGNNQYKYNQYRKYNKYNENTLDNKYKNPESQTKQSTPRYSPHPSNIFPSFPPGKSEESKRSKSMVKARSRGMHPNYITNPTYPESNMSLRPHVSSLLEARQTKLQSQGDAMYHLFMGMDINMRKSTDKRRGELDNLQIKPYANTHLTRKLLRYHQGKSQSNNPQPWPYTSNRPSNYGGGGGVGGIPVPVPVPQALPPRKFSPGILRFSRTRGSVPQHAQREVNLRHNQSYIDYLPRMVVQRGEGREGLFASGVVGAQNSPPPSPLKNKYPSPLLRDLGNKHNYLISTQLDPIQNRELTQLDSVSEYFVYLTVHRIDDAN